MGLFSPIKAFRTCYDTFELRKAGPELELHRISYGSVRRVFEAAAEVVPRYLPRHSVANTVGFICLCVRTNLISFLCSSLFQLAFKCFSFEMSSE